MDARELRFRARMAGSMGMPISFTEGGEAAALLTKNGSSYGRQCTT
jgi:hypothetical protein